MSLSRDDIKQKCDLPYFHYFIIKTRWEKPSTKAKGDSNSSSEPPQKKQRDGNGKTKALKFSSQMKQILVNGEELDDEHMHLAQKLLQKQFPHLR